MYQNVTNAIYFGCRKSKSYYLFKIIRVWLEFKIQLIRTSNSLEIRLIAGTSVIRLTMNITLNASIKNPTGKSDREFFIQFGWAFRQIIHQSFFAYIVNAQSLQCFRDVG